MKDTTIQTKAGEAVQSSSDLNREFSKITIAGIGVASVLIGGWALVCLASGIIASGGPAAMTANWFRSVIG